MKANVGTTDKIIRVIIGVALLLVAFLVPLSQLLKILFIVIGAVAILTALIGFCGAYLPFGINTCKTKTENKTV